MKNFKKPISVPYATVFATVCTIIVACAQQSSDSPKKSTTSNAQPSIPPLGNPQLSPLPSASVLPSSGPIQACWDKILKSPAALACTTMFAYSSQTCVPGVTKQASCTREDINKVYGSAQTNGQPVMTTVDQWIAAGYTDMQCAIGSDTKLYVYFLKKTFTGGDKNTASTYKFEEQTLGPAGAILSSIKLNPIGSSNAGVCGN